MTTYYVSPSGSDSNNGLGPDASHASNKPFLTAAKVFTTGSPVVPGDTVYFAPGTYFEGASLTLISGISSAASPTAFRGDPTNAQGFKNGSGVRLAPGLVTISIRTSSEINAAPAAGGTLLAANTNGTSGVQLYNLRLDAGGDTGDCIRLAVTTTNCRDWLLEDCFLTGSAGITLATGIPTANLNLTVRRTRFLGQSFLSASIASAAATADADLNILFERCISHGHLTNAMTLSAAGGNLAGGVRWKGCTAFAPSRAANGVIATTSGRVSTTTPCRVERCIIVGGVPVTGGTTGQVVDDGDCMLYPYGGLSTNFTLGTGTVQDPMPNFYFGEDVKVGVGIPRNDFLSWTSLAHADQRHGGNSNTEIDYRNRLAAPWGAGSAIGAWEYPDIAQNTGSQITGGGVNSGGITGAGDIRIPVRLRAFSTTITVVTESASYGGTNYPQMILEAVPEAGITQQTATATNASEQTLTIGPITPTTDAVGFLILRSRSSSGASSTYFDRLAAA